MKKSLMMSATFFLLSLSLTVCKKKNDTKKNEACTMVCQNGGTCVNNSCNCPDDFSGPNCETYFTSNYAGTYISTNFACGQFTQVTEIIIQVDPGNRNRLIIGSMYADMVNRTTFHIPTQGPTHNSGTLIFEGTVANLNYSANVQGTQVTCRGTFTKK